ncbi:MAG: xanthine dehydrogenase molybdopterin binding subunit [Rhodospirillaceae bacterium]|jgi:xanthine dehydrogenase large subunit|nr:xanthine dehydrogenase molybdopterin binding subunit [Rhodospirillaceae bacterium]MBT3810977.1 xanthine dehydrogenase molybdopterin binding subunit [Rhodospirillaceae bacterium]MBT4770943.1 xanthine dehydrogenase molybdopterin binding subunit [Rhodospirillaceae bacterium]MBT5359262.1 xanthine dehydrogenase molybdopterin binding subunit [Rhodospirillaceae bacterium]MBT5769131.1 xanthine dehydrogenase molybdopterin binding subunit [Rhodospirillaceae bacterium]
MNADGDIRGAVHSSVRHDSARGHVTGVARYIDDMPLLPGTQEIVLVTSPHAHARIVSIDVSAARAMDGVRGIATAADIPGHNDVGPIFDGEPILADGLADYAGAPIVAVAADTYDQAYAAAKKVVVEYEELTPVLEIEDALEREQYTYPPQIITYGDPATAIAAASRRIKGELRCGGQDHFYLESNIALAVPRDDGDLDVYSSTQHPSEVQHGVAHALGVASNAVTVEVRRMGGGFGGKESQPTIIAAIAALMAVITGRPAKLRLRRDDDMIVTGKRHDFLFRYEAGFDDTGRIDGVDILMGMRSGNVADLSPGVLARALCHADNCYHLPNARLAGYPCKTNTVSNTAFRGFGGPQGMIVIEAMLEHIARELGMPLDDVRAVNYYGTDERNVTPYQQTVKDNIIVPLVERLQAEVDFDGMSKAVDDFNASHETLKKGLALMPVKFGISFNTPKLNQAGALVHVYADGSVHLNHGGTEMGQGLFTKVAQVVASVFQIDLDNIKISATRTDKVPNTSATAASSGSDLNGMAAFNAANTIKDRMTGVAAEIFDTDADQVEFRQNRVYAGNESLSFSELAEQTYNRRVQLSAAGFYSTPGLHWDAKSLIGNPFYYFTYGAAIAEVVIDTLTGESRVLRADMLQDCGNSLNPAIDIGQIEGAFVQGQGWLTSEELVWNDRGQLLTHGPSTYKIPGSRDVPPVFNVHILEDAPNRFPTVFRSKAVGEPPLMLAISVWLAIRDAVSRTADHRHFVKLDAPATPEVILNAIEDVSRRDSVQ